MEGKTYVTVDELKRHLNIDYEEDDVYLGELLAAAESAVELYLQRPLSELLDDSGNLVADMRMAVRLLAGGYYANREPAAFAAATEIPYGLSFLLTQRRRLK